MTEAALPQTVRRGRGLSAAGSRLRSVMGAAASAWPSTRLTAIKKNPALICLLLYLFIVHSGRLPIAQEVLSLGLILSFTLRGGIRFPAASLWFGALVVWALITAPMSPYAEVAGVGAFDLLKVWLIALLAANAIRTRDELRLFILIWLGLFGLFPIRGTMMNYLAGIGLFGRYAWNFVFRNPNDLASFCLLQIALCVGLLQVERVKWLRVMAILGVISLAFIILITQSRGGMLGFASFLLLALVWQRHRLRTMVFIGFAGIVVLAAAPEKVLGRLGGLTALTGGLSHVSEVDPEQSAASRYAIWRVAMTIFRDNPIIGIGWSAYPDAHRVVVRRIEGAPRTAFGARDAHGTYVKLLAESGVVGLVLFLGIVISSRREIVRVARQIKDTQPEVSRFLRMLLVGQIAYLQCAIFGSYEHLPFFYLYTMMSVVAARLYAKETAAVPLAPLPGPVQTLPQRAFRLRRGGGAVAQLGPG